MTPLRQRMIDAMVLRGMAARTQQAYLGVVAQLARYYRRSPDDLDAGEVRAWLLHRINERQLAYETVKQAVCALKFLFATVLGREAEALAIPYPHTPQRQPEILSREELSRLFAAANGIRSRTLLMTTYAAGLRVSEVCALRLADIDSAADRMCLRVVGAKGGKDRYTLLTPSLLEALRLYWRACRPQHWLFPGARDPRRPFDAHSAQRIFYRARARAGITKSGGIHCLRHGFATHLLGRGGPGDIVAAARSRPPVAHAALPTPGAPGRHAFGQPARPAAPTLTEPRGGAAESGRRAARVRRRLSAPARALTGPGGGVAIDS